ncbi:MAG: hypothetical protein WC650_05640 [Candidatus Doudnabacteria bacterium]
MFRKIVAVLLSIIFFFLFALVLYGYNVKYVFLKPGIYKELLEQGRITSVLTSLIVSSLQKSQTEGTSQGSQEGKLPITPDAIGQALTNIISKAGLEKEVVRVVDNFFAWLYSDDPSLDLAISLKGLKQAAQPELQKMQKQTLLQLPRCTPSQLKSSQGKPTGCLPPNIKDADLDKLVNETVSASSLKDIPDTFDLLNLNQNKTPASAGSVNSEELIMSGLNKFRDYVHLGFFILNFAAVILVILLVSIGLLTWRPFAAVLKKIGIVLLVSGLPIFLLSLCLYLFAVSIKISDILKLVQTPIALDPAILNNIGSIFSDISGRFNLFKSVEAGVIIGFSIILLIIGAVLKKSRVAQQK